MGVTITSTTSSQEQLDHAASENWREPFVPKESEPKAEPEPKEVELSPEETAEKEETPEAPKPQPKGHKGAGAQKRIDKLTAQNARLEKELEELRAKATPPAEPALQAPKEPKLADFGNDLEKFLKARDEWKQNSEKAAAEAERRKSVVDSYNEKISKARGEYDDWDEVVAGSKITIPQKAVEAVIELDNGPDVAYYLAQHPDEAQALSDLSEVRLIHAIGKISDKLAATKTAPAAPKPKVKPPEPLAPVGASSTRSSIPIDQLPIREYIKIRNRQERENRGR